MQTREDNKDDLDYLSQQGFERVAVNASDLRDLKAQIRKKSASFGGRYLSLGSLLVGMIIGGILIFFLNKRPVAGMSSDKTKLQGGATSSTVSPEAETI